MQYLGEYAPGQTVRFAWNTNAVAGESITRATNGTIHVYKDGASGTEVTTGVTDTEDFDTLTGVHYCEIATSDAFYATGSHYMAVLKAATIDGKTINAVLASWRIKKEIGATVVEFVREKDATDQTVEVFIRDLRTGQGLTGLVFNTSGLTARYQRLKADSVAITLATQTVTGAHSDGGFVEIDATHRPGWYRLDLPDAAVATGVDDVGVTVYGAANMADAHVHVALVSSLTVTNGVVSADMVQISGDATAANNLEAALDGTGGVTVTANITGNVTGDLDGNVTGSVASVVGNIGGSVDSVLNNVGGNVVGSVGSVTGNVGGNVTGSVGSLAAQAKADVNAEVLDVLNTDTFAELSAVPAAATTLRNMIHYTFLLATNKSTQTSTTKTLRNRADNATIGTQAVSDDGTTFTQGSAA